MLVAGSGWSISQWPDCLGPPKRREMLVKLKEPRMSWATQSTSVLWCVSADGFEAEPRARFRALERCLELPKRPPALENPGCPCCLQRRKSIFLPCWKTERMTQGRKETAVREECPVSPAGGDGPSGLRGETGLKICGGERGAPGDLCTTQQSSFSVGRRKAPHSADYYQTMNFDTVFVNLEQHLNMFKGRFYCFVPGVYFFNVNIHTWNFKETLRTFV